MKAYGESYHKQGSRQQVEEFTLTRPSCAWGGAVNGSLWNFTDYTVLGAGHCAPFAQWSTEDHSFDTEALYFCPWEGGKEDEHDMESLRGLSSFAMASLTKYGKMSGKQQVLAALTILEARSTKSGVSGALLPLKRLRRIYPGPVPSLC